MVFMLSSLFVAVPLFARNGIEAALALVHFCWFARSPPLPWEVVVQMEINKLRHTGQKRGRAAPSASPYIICRVIFTYLMYFCSMLRACIRNGTPGRLFSPTALSPTVAKTFPSRGAHSFLAASAPHKSHSPQYFGPIIPIALYALWFNVTA